MKLNMPNTGPLVPYLPSVASNSGLTAPSFQLCRPQASSILFFSNTTPNQSFSKSCLFSKYILPFSLSTTTQAHGVLQDCGNSLHQPLLPVSPTTTHSPLIFKMQISPFTLCLAPTPGVGSHGLHHICLTGIPSTLTPDLSLSHSLLIMESVLLWAFTHKVPCFWSISPLLRHMDDSSSPSTVTSS